jgi:spore photoproduct lyase
MSERESYGEKLSRIAAQTPFFCRLPAEQREFLRRKALDFRFSRQELRQISEIGVDLRMWGAPSIIDAWPEAPAAHLPPKERRTVVIHALLRYVERQRNTRTRYRASAQTLESGRYRILSSDRKRGRLGLGRCPVASERTRCCNLLTLDAVENCGFGCSYCSIQSFYHDDEIHFDSGFGSKLRALELDPQRTYHIGTGQSSDSLMWGNRFGVLDALADFARRHPNVILELKTKSKNVSYLLKNRVPRNLICTWSLNPQSVIENEEHRTAGLEERLRAARRVADRGILVGFHLHPMVHYADWRTDYADLLGRVEKRFDPTEVAMVSFGTLTFTKSVIRRIRNRGLTTRVLQMPLTESDGKLSYPDEIKLQLFSHAYRSLSAWHGRVFFYLCMESHRLWHAVLGKDYSSNQVLEEAMKASYLDKIQQDVPPEPNRGRRQAMGLGSPRV